jgi:hypothetical protein
MAQAIVRNHHQVLRRISHHHLHFTIRVKKGNQVLEKKKQNLPVLKNWTILDYPVSQTGWSSFGRTEDILSKEDDCSTSSSDDDDDADDEYDEKELLVEFMKLISKHMKLQKRHEDLLCSHKELMGSYALLEAAHEVMVTMVKDSQPHTCTYAKPSIDLSCANSCCSQAKPSCDEHVLVETCDSLITSENDELKRENEMLKMELSRLKGKGHMQPS